MKQYEVRERRPDYVVKPDSIQYSFEYEPIRGYPELRWTGKRPFKGTTYFPAQLKESHGDTVDGWRNKLYWGDNLQVMSHLLREYRGKVRLIYIDPPFDSKADYKKKIELRGMSASSNASVFEEKQYTDIWTNDEYLQFMYERLILMRELLSEDGSIYLHCDYRLVAYIRLILQEIFGNNLLNEIIWHYESGGIPQKKFSQKHDLILSFTKSSNYIFNSRDACFQRNICQLCGSKLDKWNNLKKEVDGNGRIFRTVKSAGKIYKYYDDEPALLSDVWVDINHIQQKDPERVGYPTQKPEALLERIIRASSDIGDLVFDCFMGSGTTQAVAMKLGRRFLGADINLGAIQTTTKRLLGVAEELKKASPELALGDAGKSDKFYTGFEVYTVNRYDFFRNELEARELLIEALELQALPGNMLWDGESDGWMVKILAVNRLATAADLNPILGNLDYKAWEKRAKANPEKPVERIRLVCMGHDPELRAMFQKEIEKLGYKVDIEVLDILRDKQELQFKRDSEARIVVTKKKLEIKKFYPMNLLGKLSLEKTKVGDWRELVDSVLIDWNYDGAVFSPALLDIPEKNELVKGIYDLPEDHGAIRVKITDLLAESWEGDVEA